MVHIPSLINGTHTIPFHGTNTRSYLSHMPGLIYGTHTWYYLCHTSYLSHIPFLIYDTHTRSYLWYTYQILFMVHIPSLIYGTWSCLCHTYPVFNMSPEVAAILHMSDHHFCSTRQFRSNQRYFVAAGFVHHEQEVFIHHLRKVVPKPNLAFQVVCT